MQHCIGSCLIPSGARRTGKTSSKLGISLFMINTWIQKKKKKSNLKASEIAVCTWFTFSSKSFCRIFCLASSNGSPELRCAKLVGKGSKTGKPIGGVCTTARAKAATTVFLETPILNFPFNHKTRSQIAVYLKRTHYVLRLALPARYK